MRVFAAAAAVVLVREEPPCAEVFVRVAVRVRVASVPVVPEATAAAPALESPPSFFKAALAAPA